MSFDVRITRRSTDDDIRAACEATLHGATSRASIPALYRSEHSPIRCDWYWLELLGIKSFVSVHLVRHSIGVTHFVESMRDDRGGAGDDVVTRNSPVNHRMLLNAQALINISRKRLCFKSHTSTVEVWLAVRRAGLRESPRLHPFLVPECVYRGFCPESKQCKPGLKAVLAAYPKSDAEMCRDEVRKRQGAGPC